MDDYIKISKSKIFSVSVTFFYALLTSIVSIYHEPWRDEAQAWLIARDLDIVSLFKQMRYEGTPALWHLILFPFAKLNFPYGTITIIHLVIAISMVYLFVSYAPFSRITKLLFIFSYYIAYEYAIIARNYNIAILLLFLIAIFYKERFEHPIRHSFLIFLLFNTNIYGFFMASSLSLIYVWELVKEKKQLKLYCSAILIMCLGGILSFIQMLPHKDAIGYHSIKGLNYLGPGAGITNAFFPDGFFM